MRKILHIDMNSYFATVEQQANPRLRGEPVAVLGSHAKRTIIVAASVEAKKFGVKTGTRVEEAPGLCPNIVFVHGEPRKYSWVTKKFIEIFESYTDKVEIFSIDEAFLEVTQTSRLFEKTNNKKQKNPVISTEVEKSRFFGGEWRGSINIALEIKQRIRDEIGSYITCSVGIASNKFMAKTASDLVKPDGLVIITPNNKQQTTNSKKEDVIARSVTTRQSFPTVLTVDEVLLELPLSEFCGIGRRIHQRLGALGIHTTADLRNISNIILNKEFGIATGEKLKRMAYGLDNSPVVSWHDRADAKSYSHSRTLNKDVTDVNEMKKHILLLSEKLATHMRRDNMMGREVGLWLRFKDFSGAGKSMKTANWTHDGLEIGEAANKILKILELRQPVRAIGVYVGRVQRSSNVTVSLLPEDVLNDKILSAMDGVNSRYGENVVTRARLTGLKIKEIVSGMGRDKF
jgi:DNA polymerase-4